ncbi:unnamed protein product [Lepidochelys olivacea]
MVRPGTGTQQTPEPGLGSCSRPGALLGPGAPARAGCRERAWQRRSLPAAERSAPAPCAQLRDESEKQRWPGRRPECRHSRRMEPAQRREWDTAQRGSPPSKTAEGGEGHPGSQAWQDLEVTGIWPASARYAQPMPKWGEAAARGRRPEGPGVSRAQPEPPKPGPRATWGPKLHSALTGWPRGGDPPQTPPPKPRGPYRSRLAGPGWLLPPEAAGAGVSPSPPEGSLEDNLLLIDAQGVPYTVSRRDLEAGPAPAPRRAHCCPVCRRAFLYLSDLERHRISHSEHKPHLCRACGKAFKRASHLQRHRNIHTGERPFRCAVCQKGFRESGELLRHQRVHTGEKPYQCPLCRLRFTERNTLRRHAKRKHAREACCQGAGLGAWAGGAEGRPGWAGESGQEVGPP